LRFNKTPSQRRTARPRPNKTVSPAWQVEMPDAISARSQQTRSRGYRERTRNIPHRRLANPVRKKGQQRYERERLTRTGKGADGTASALMGIRSTDAGIVNNLSLTKRWYVWPERESGVATRRALTPTRVEVELTACHSVCGSGCSLAGFYGGGGGCRSGCAQPSAHDDARSLDHAARTQHQRQI
jgi:hypothetical protein